MDMKQLLICALSLSCLTSSMPVWAKDATTSTQYQKALSSVAIPELPVKAAELVKQAKSDDWVITTVAVTKTAIAINPSTAPSVVGAIARSVPDMASVAAGTAAAELPKQAAAIAKAAAAAAPSKAGKIVAAVCKAAPKDYRAVAIAVTQTVPGSAKEVLAAVTSAIPELKSGVAAALAAYSGDSISVATVLDQATASLATETVKGSTVRGPTVGPPFIALSGTPTTVTPATSGQVPTGGRGYARP